MFVEPLLICPNSKYINIWHHPEIFELTKDLEITNKDTLAGDLIRADIKFNDNRILHIVFITDKNGVNECMSDSGLNDYIGRLTVLLTEPIWDPGGTFFVETEYGEIFNRMYPVGDEDFTVLLTPNVSLVNQNDEWWFTSYY